MYALCTLNPYFSYIYFNIILKSTFRFAKCVLSLINYEENVSKFFFIFSFKYHNPSISDFLF